MNKLFIAIVFVTLLSCSTNEKKLKYFYNKDQAGISGNVKEIRSCAYSHIHFKNNEWLPVLSTLTDSTIRTYNEDGYLTGKSAFIFNNGTLVKKAFTEYTFSNSIPVKSATYVNDTLVTTSELTFINDTTLQEQTHNISDDKFYTNTNTIKQEKNRLIETDYRVVDEGPEQIDIITVIENFYSKDWQLENYTITSSTTQKGASFSNGIFDIREKIRYIVLEKDDSGNTLKCLLEATTDFGKQCDTTYLKNEIFYY